MELIIVILLSVLISLVLFTLYTIKSSGKGRDSLESVLNEKFMDFSFKMRETMDDTRKEVERSKDMLSTNAVKTLEHIKEMSEAMGNLAHHQEKAEKLGQSLETLLQAPKLRGNYGETVLEEMLEKIMPRKTMWDRQYLIEDGVKVDAVVKYRNVVVPIDSKFPREDYQRYISATDGSMKKTCWAGYEKALKVQINSIREKYVKPEKGTTEFALLFIPSESIYYETISERNFFGEPSQIYEYATAKKVIPVSPSTFYAFLQIIILGVRNIEIAMEAKKLQEQFSKIEKDFTYFYNKFEAIGKYIDNAQTAFSAGEKHAKRFKNNVMTLLKMEKTDRVDSTAESKPDDPR